jgi:hypothetical protein
VVTYIQLAVFDAEGFACGLQRIGAIRQCIGECPEVKEMSGKAIFF